MIIGHKVFITSLIILLFLLPGKSLLADMEEMGTILPKSIIGIALIL